MIPPNCVKPKGSLRKRRAHARLSRVQELSRTLHVQCWLDLEAGVWVSKTVYTASKCRLAITMVLEGMDSHDPSHGKRH